jgi:hypothetical protein
MVIVREQSYVRFPHFLHHIKRLNHAGNKAPLVRVDRLKGNKEVQGLYNFLKPVEEFGELGAGGDIGKAPGTRPGVAEADKRDTHFRAPVAGGLCVVKRALKLRVRTGEPYPAGEKVIARFSRDTLIRKHGLYRAPHIRFTFHHSIQGDFNKIKTKPRKQWDTVNADSIFIAHKRTQTTPNLHGVLLKYCPL